VSLRLYGFTGHRTNQAKNQAYLNFNSTTKLNGSTLFDGSMVSISPALLISNFEQVNDKMYRFNFEIKFTNASSADPDNVQCLSPSANLPTKNSTMFRCSKCPHSQRCTLPTTYPTLALDHQEFPFALVVHGIPALGMNETKFEVFFDTLWAAVALEAPAYAQSPFFITVVWSEPMEDLTAIKPMFDPSGPAVDQDLLQYNLTVLSPTSFRMLISPVETGILIISINGTKQSIDLAGNTNDFRANTASRTGASKVVVYSGGPPLQGSVGFQYKSPAVPYQYQPTLGPMIVSPSLIVSWRGFITATHYDLWVTWGQNLTSPVLQNLTSGTYELGGFEAYLGLEYMVHLVARNFWGQELLLTKVFLHPRLDVVADGTQKALSLPKMMSQLETPVALVAFIVPKSFLFMNPLQVLSFRSIDRQAGDSEPCNFNTQQLRCTFMNFHIEAPATKFLVFREPIRLQFTFGLQGWQDMYFRPELRYWEVFHEEWRAASESCPSDKKFERWNDLHGIYTVSVCHLTQFGMFEFYSPPVPTTTTAPTERPESADSPMFFVGFAGIVACILFCCAVIYLCKRGTSARKPAFEEFGIRPTTERFPSRRQVVGKQRQKEDSRELLAALPGSPMSSWVHLGGDGLSPRDSEEGLEVMLAALEDAVPVDSPRPPGSVDVSGSHSD